MRAVFMMIFTLTLAGMLVLQSTAFAADGLPTCFGVTYDVNDPAHILGTNGDDQIVGTSDADVIFGLNGNDVILGQGGDDIICGGNGDDVLRGRGGADRINGGNGDDVLWGGSDEGDQLLGARETTSSEAAMVTICATGRGVMTAPTVSA